MQSTATAWSTVRFTQLTAYAANPSSLGADLIEGRFWTLRPSPPLDRGSCFPPFRSGEGWTLLTVHTHTHKFASDLMYADSFAPLVSADNACTVVRERPTLNVTPQGGRSATDPGPSTTGGLFEAGVPKLGDPSVAGGAGDAIGK